MCCPLDESLLKRSSMLIEPLLQAELTVRCTNLLSSLKNSLERLMMSSSKLTPLVGECSQFIKRLYSLKPRG